MTDRQPTRAERSHRDSTLRTARAWAIKEEAKWLWEPGPHELVLCGWRRWLSWVQRCRIPEMVKAGRMVRGHLSSILNAIRREASTAVAESINATIQRANQMACGSGGRKRPRNAISFHAGGLQPYPDEATPHGILEPLHNHVGGLQPHTAGSTHSNSWGPLLAHEILSS